MWHVSALPVDFPGRDAVAAALEVVAHELEPLATTFFTVGADGEVDSCVAHGSHLPAAELARDVRGWKARLRGVDLLAPAKLAEIPRRVATLADVETDTLPAVYEQIGVLNDARLLIRDSGRLVAAVTLWRPVRGRRWSGAQLRMLAALGPLIEMAYLGTVRTDSGGEARLPETLTPRQRQVARLIAAGATNSEIARSLYVSPDTAKSHTRAVLSKLGVSSRRELAMQLRRSPAPGVDPDEAVGPDLSGISWPSRRSWGELSIRFAGDSEPQRVLAALLEWAAERIGEVIGGYACLSARSQVAAQAWGAAGARDSPLTSVHQLHDRLLSEDNRAKLSHSLESDRASTSVIELPVPLRRDPRLAQLVTRTGVANPLLAILRTQGRVSGLAWLSRDRQTTVDQRETGQALSAVHPLLKLTHDAELGGRRGRAPTSGGLAALGLTSREAAVTRLALLGRGNAAIARELGISQSTVKKHMSRVLDKCGVRSRTQLIALLGESGSR